jgi:hypothetical protein
VECWFKALPTRSSFGQKSKSVAGLLSRPYPASHARPRRRNAARRI